MNSRHRLRIFFNNITLKLGRLFKAIIDIGNSSKNGKTLLIIVKYSKCKETRMSFKIYLLRLIFKLLYNIFHCFIVH